MVVGAAGNDVDATFNKGPGHGPGIRHHLLLIGHELGARGLLEADRLGRNHVHQRPALAAREYRGLEFLFQRLVGARQDDAAAGAAQGLVGGRGDHVRVRHRVGVDPRRHQASHVGHVHQQVGAHFVGNSAEARPVHDPGIGGEAGHDHLRLVLQRQRFHLVIVDLASIRFQTKLNGVVHLAGKIRLGTVSQVAAICQAHAQHGVAGVAQGQVDRRVGLGTGVGLDVGVVGAEQGLGAINRQLLGLVNELTAAVVALARVAFRILVGQHRALGLHDPGAGVVLRCDKLDMFFLATLFFLDRREDLVVEACNGHALVKHRCPLAGGGRERPGK